MVQSPRGVWGCIVSCHVSGWSWTWCESRPCGAGSWSPQCRELYFCLWPELLVTRPLSLAGSNRPTLCRELRSVLAQLEAGG